MWTLLLSPAGKGGKGQAASQRLRWRSCGSCQPAFPSLTIPPPPSSTALSTTVLPPPQQRRRRRQRHDLGGSMGASLAPPDPRFSILEGRPPPPGCRALSPIPVVLSIAPPTYLHSLGVDPSHKAIVGITSPRSGRFEVNKCHETVKTVGGWQ